MQVSGKAKDRMKKKKRRTRDINLRTYDDRKGTPDGKHCDSDERSKNCSFHDEKTVMDRVFAEEKIVIGCCRVRELKFLRHGEGFFICSMGWLTVIMRG